MPSSVFISHIHEERALGEVVKSWIEDSFTGHEVRAFLSSDRRDLPAGKRWRDVVEPELEGATVVVGLLSPTSLPRSWVNIEIGAAWILKKSVIPLCHSGLVVGQLPPPFGDFQGVGLDQADAAERLLEGVAAGVGLRLPKRLHHAQCLAEMKAAAGKSLGVQPTAGMALVAKPALKELLAEQVALLQIAAHSANQGEEQIAEGEIVGAARVQPAAAKYHLNCLVEDALLIAHWDVEGRHFSLAPAGARWLIESGAMPG